jgi:hypothetical protein
MAKYTSKNSMTGLSGIVGNAVFYVSNGMQLVRIRPTQNKSRKLSELQKAHIGSFKAQHAFARSIKHGIIDRIWSQLDIPAGMNPYNYFIKSNSDAFGKTALIQFPQLIILSMGKLLPVENLKAELANNQLFLKWKYNNDSAYASATDKLNIAILINKTELKFLENNFIRSDEKAELNLDNSETEIIEGFVFWSSQENDAFSRSEYWACSK